MKRIFFLLLCAAIELGVNAADYQITWPSTPDPYHTLYKTTVFQPPVWNTVVTTNSLSATVTAAEPTAFFAVTAYRTSYNVSWVPSPDPLVINYTLLYGTAPRAYTESVFAGSATNIPVTGLRGDTVYYFAVVGFDADGNVSDWSPEGCSVGPKTMLTGLTIKPVVSKIDAAAIRR